MPFKDFRLGPFIPDLAGLPNPSNPAYLVVCEGVRPTPQGYRAISALTALASQSGLTGTTAVGSLIPVRGSTGTITFNMFIAASRTSTSGYIEQTADDGQNWSNIVGPSGHVGQWPDFAIFDDLIIIVGSPRVPQYKNVSAAVSAALADLGGSPPRAATVARLGGHIILGYLVTGSAEDFSAVQWCAIGDPTDWPTPGTADAFSKQAGKEILPREYGDVTRVVASDNFVLVFQEYAITRMTYVGGAEVYRFDTFEKTIGTGEMQFGSISDKRPHAVIQVGGEFIFFNQVSMYRTDGFSVVDMLAGRIEEWNIGSVGVGINEAVYDPALGIALFLVTDATWGSTTYLGWNQRTDELFMTTGSDYASLAYTNNRIYNATLDELQTMSGSDESVVIQTGFMELVPGRLTKLIGASPIGVGSDALTLSFKSINDDESISTVETGFTALTEQTRSLKHTAASSSMSRYHALRLTGTIGDLLGGVRVYYEVGPEL